MADCSKTINFFAEAKRMCDTLFSCKECIFYDLGECNLSEITQNHIDQLQKWSDEHPAPKPKTYADDFFEKFPEAIRIDGKPVSCRANLYRTSCRWKSCNNVDQCAKDCLSCWNEVMPE